MAEIDDKRMWGIHTMNDFLFLNNNMIAIGWKNMGDLSLLPPSREGYKEKYIAVYPDAKKQSVATGAGMLYRFVHELNVGDYIIFPSKMDRKINIGQVESEYIFSPGETEYVQQRKVKWLKHLSRTVFTQGALYEVGSALSFFSIKNSSFAHLI